MTFGQVLKKLRNEHNLTQLQVATKINLSKANISKYEAGLVEPNLDTLNSISELFDVSLDYLLGQDGKKIKATHEDVPLTEEQKELLTAVTELDNDELKKALEYVELLKLKQKTPSVLLAARDGGGFDSVDSQTEEKARLIKEHPKSNKKLP